MDALAPDGIYTYKRPCHVHVYLELYYDVCKTPIIWLYTVQPGRPEFLIKIQQNDFTSPNKQVCSVVYCVCVWVKYSDNLYHHNHYTTLHYTKSWGKSPALVYNKDRDVQLNLDTGNCTRYKLLCETIRYVCVFVRMLCEMRLALLFLDMYTTLHYSLPGAHRGAKPTLCVVSCRMTKWRYTSIHCTPTQGGRREHSHHTYSHFFLYD
jgi:hypothetical protein